ncbi:MAG TPA: inositol monophosphatase family protein [Bryobacteraceae bacterium]|nr:inositol monophosphatase family protein [Bryobacteraceae bacterium]
MASFVETAAEIACQAGSLLRYYFERRVSFEMKGDFDLVTEADKASEKLVVERLRQSFPDHSIVAEEGGGHEDSSDYRWYVDPLDGTTNFAHSYPLWNVTLALEKAGELIAGVVFDPTRDELYTCERGAGSFLNGRRISVSKCARVADSLLCTGFPNHNRATNPNIHFFHELAMTAHGVRRSGSAAVDLANVACGRLDGFWEIGLSPWDMAAGILLVQEAGGICTDMNGHSHHLKAPHVLTDNGFIHQELLGVFEGIWDRGPAHPLPPLRRL